MNIKSELIDEAKEILKYYGAEARKRQLIEEMAELTKTLNKEWRFNMGYIEGDEQALKDNIIEEMADVIIMLAQMFTVYECSDSIWDIIENKINRMLNTIGLKEAEESSGSRPKEESGQ